MLNQVIIQGRLTREPELRTTQNGVAVVAFTLACDRDYQKDQVDFVPCIAWRKTAEFVSKYFHKGQLVLAHGSLQLRNWTDKEGNKRTTPEIVCDAVHFCESKRSVAEDGYSAGEPEYRGPQPMDVVADEADLPF